MKKLSLIAILIIFSRLAYAVCDTSVVVTATSSTNSLCAGDSARLCAEYGYLGPNTTYLWSNGATTECMYTIYAGNYRVTVTSDSGCIYVSNWAGFGNEPVFPDSVINVGDTLELLYPADFTNEQWFLNGQPISNGAWPGYYASVAGNYSVSVTDPNGCPETSSTINFVPPYPYAVSLGPSQTVCSGSQVTLQPVVSNGVPPYYYSWAFYPENDYPNCNQCQYPTITITQSDWFSVTVFDANNDTASADIFYYVSGTGSLPQLTLTNTNLTCLQPVDTTVADITNGVPPFVINWGDGTSTTSASPAVHNYGQSGVYIISLSDTSGCATSAFDTVTGNGINISVVEQVSPECNASANGKIIINALGGIAPYSYLWSTGSSTDSAINLSSQNYSVTVTDSAGCMFIQSFHLNANDGDFYVFVNETDANCGVNGALNVVPGGGAPPYSYVWSNDSTTQNIQGIAAGGYTVTITDNFGCSTTASATVNGGCLSYITGVAFIDFNNNCIFDSGDADAGDVYITATGESGQGYYGSTVNNGYGYYIIAVDSPGVYNLAATVFSGGGVGCANLNFCGNNNQTVIIAAAGDTVSNNNFGLSPSTGFDLVMHPGWTTANPGFEKEYWVMPYCQSVIPFTDTATVVFTYDSNLIYEYSLPPLPAVNLIAHTLTWVVDSVPHPYFDWNNVRFRSFFLVPANLSTGYLLQSDFYITPTVGDCDSANNNMYFSDLITGSRDPNEKTVSPSGQITENDSVLTYTIHYQNTGTDSTFFIVVLDTLPQGLNPATVQNLASSDKYSDFGISGKGILKWTFNPLRLPDSTSSPSGSKGFITFSVKKFENLPLGTAISNTASIYFDYNQPVRTNAAVDTISFGTGIAEINKNVISVTAFPNPFADATNIVVTGINEKYNFQLFDVTGQLLKEVTGIGQSQFKLNRGQMPSGIYFYRLTIASKQVAYGKLVAE